MSTRLSALIFIVGLASVVTAADNAAPDYSTEVRPILANHCFKCHGPDEKGRKGKLRLDDRVSATAPAKSGEVAVVPGKPDASELVKRIFTKDEDELMPPPAAKKELNDKEKDILRRWIAAGADYQPHWAFVVPNQAALPKVADAAWVANPIDQFVLARLEQEKLKPSPAADRATLIRRVSLDLIGLPPTPAEVDDFIADTSSDAYSKLVDRLLASPRYGERWARKWLDLARYADTNGYEKDRQRSMWPWRDWVINAINADMPFDQFTIRQIAGDLLPNATTQDRIATGFHRNTMLNEEGGIDPLEYRFYSMVDRMATTGKTWLGLTTGCAQCHTHKFDPITQREYYQMMALMNNADEPVSMIKPDDFAQRAAEAETKMVHIIDGLPTKYPIDIYVWNSDGAATFTSTGGEKAEQQKDGSWLLSGDGAEKDTYTVTIDSKLTEFSGLRLEVLPDGERMVGRAAGGNFVINELTVSAGPRDGELKTVKLKSAVADFSQNDFDVKGAIDGKSKTGWALQGSDLKAMHTATFTAAEPLRAAAGVRVQVTISQQHGEHHTLRRFRLLLGHEDPARNTQQAHLAAADLAFDRWLAEQRKTVVHWRQLRPSSASSVVPILNILPDNSVLSSGDITKSDVYTTICKTDLAGVTAVRLEALPDESLPNGGPGRVYYEGQSGDFILCEFTATAEGKKLTFARAEQSAGDGNSVAKAIDGKPDTGWSIGGESGRAHSAMFVLDQPIAKGAELNISMLFERYYASSLGRYRISVTTDVPPSSIDVLPADVAAVVMTPAAKRTPAQISLAKNYWLTNAPELKNARSEIENIRNSLRSFPTTLVMAERSSEHTRPTFIHSRGEFLQPGERVEPGTFSVLNPFPKDAPNNRLGFAKWLVARDNPLAARVTVNRYWASFFGRGIVRTIDDFGYQGEAPSHPALLDWLAVEFMERGWSVKALHKLIVNSATYRQASPINQTLLARDPHNVLLARGPRFRVEAEMIRDSMLTAAGLLSAKIGGPSVFPPQPASVTTEGAYGSLNWSVSGGEDRYRRGLYTFMKRTAPYAMTNAFDAPSGDFCIAQREISNSPLQSLMMLNDAVVIEAAQALAKAVIGKSADSASRVTEIMRRCLARYPSADEITRLSAFVARQQARFVAKELDPAALAGKGDGDQAERAAWTALARAVMNTDEFVTKE
jgi:mono/diheme cytochrome c family protein